MPVRAHGRTYRRRQPERSALYATLQQHLETFLAEAAHQGEGLPRFVARELRAFLRCGILAHGFARVRCGDCAADRFVAFSCKGRGFCPSCAGKRMTRTAEHLVDDLLPEAPVRQWVLTLPHRLRYRIAYDHDLHRKVLSTYWRALQRSYERRARAAGLADGQTGAITFIQRFGSALNLNPHFHTQCLDGTFAESPSGALAFSPLPAPTSTDVAAVLQDLTARLRPILDAAGLLGDDSQAEDPLSLEAPLLSSCYAGAITQTAALGPRAGRRPDRLGTLPGARWQDKSRDSHARLDGFDLHAAVHVRATQRDRLEQLLRYCARPPISHDRLRALGDGRLALTLKTPWHDGTSHILLRPEELIQRLVALIPRPHKNLTVYHGVLAPNAKLRPRIAAMARAATERRAARQSSARHLTSPVPPTGLQARELKSGGSEWARLMRRAFDIDVLSCPRCGGAMRLIAMIDHPAIARRILRHLGLRDHAPPIAPARTTDLDFHAA